MLKQGSRAKLFDTFWSKTREKSILLEMPGSKTLDLVKAIRPGSSAFQILAFLARQTELKMDIIMCEHDYKRTSRKARKAEVSALPEYDPASVRDYAFAYNENHRKQIRSGVQIEGKQEQNSPLKVAIYRLKEQLGKLNVGPANQLFIYEKDGYRPQFELGIVVYAVKSKPKS